MTQSFAPVLLLAGVEDHADEPSGIDLLLPPTSELIAGLIAFAIIFAFVWKWVLPAVNRMLAARQEAITGQLTAAEQSKKEAESLLEDYRQQLAKARDEAGRIIDEARQTADTLRQEMVAKAEADAEAISRKGREDAAAERERAAGQIRDEVARLSLELAQKVVAGSIDAKAQQKLLDRYIDELEGLKA